MSKFFFLAIILCFSVITKGQNNSQADQGQRLARKIAQKMKDTLNLNGNQMNQIYDINITLSNLKKQAFTSGHSRDSISKKIQQIENTRDSLYKAVIPQDKFQLYKQKKRNLVNNN